MQKRLERRRSSGSPSAAIIQETWSTPGPLAQWADNGANQLPVAVGASPLSQPVAEIVERDLGACVVHRRQRQQARSCTLSVQPLAGRGGQPAGRMPDEASAPCASAKGEQGLGFAQAPERRRFLVGHADRQAAMPRRRRAGRDISTGGRSRRLGRGRARASVSRSISVSNGHRLLLGVAPSRQDLHPALSDAVVAPPVTARWRFDAGSVDPDRLRGLRTVTSRGDQGVGGNDDAGGRPVVLDQEAGLRLVVVGKLADEFDRRRRRLDVRRRRRRRRTG